MGENTKGPPRLGGCGMRATKAVLEFLRDTRVGFCILLHPPYVTRVCGTLASPYHLLRTPTLPTAHPSHSHTPHPSPHSPPISPLTPLTPSYHQKPCAPTTTTRRSASSRRKPKY